MLDYKYEWVVRLEDFSFSPMEKEENKQKNYNLEEIEKNTILEVMKITRYKKQAAKLLNITPQALNRRLIKYNIKW